MTKQVKVYAGSDTYEKWQKICERFSSNTAAFAVVVENYFNQIQEDTMDTQTLYEQAKNRVEDSETLAPHIEFILADWPEGDEHLQWVIDTSDEEILDWVIAGNR